MLGTADPRMTRGAGKIPAEFLLSPLAASVSFRDLWNSGHPGIPGALPLPRFSGINLAGIELDPVKSRPLSGSLEVIPNILGMLSPPRDPNRSEQFPAPDPALIVDY